MKKRKVVQILVIGFIAITGILYTKYDRPSKEEGTIVFQSENPNVENTKKAETNHPNASMEDKNMKEHAIDTLGDSLEQVETLSQETLNSGKEDTTSNENQKEEVSQNQVENGTDSDAAGEQEHEIYVHICGAVKNPGVYQATSTSRLIDVVQQAGGLEEDAAEEFINLAQSVVDGKQFYIPNRSDVDEKDAMDYVATHATEEEGNSDITEDKNEYNNENQREKTKLIDLNQATKEELMTIPGIGDAKAQLILDYRQDNGGFHTIEDVMNIRGIKQGLFQKMKDYITVM